MLRLLRFDNQCQIDGEDDNDIFKQLDEHLSYKILGAEYSKAYKGYTNNRGEEVSWDGIKHIMTSSGRFPPGLFERVIDFYRSKGIFPQVIDRREPKTSSVEFDISKRLIELGKTPRPYQIEATEKAAAVERGIIRLATGAGKTLIAAMITAKLNKSTIIYVIGTDLLYQLQKLFADIFQQEIGIIGDGHCEIKDINIATIWSIGKVLGVSKTTIDDDEEKEKAIDPDKFRQIKHLLLNTKTHIMDECHLAACDTVQDIARNINAEYVYGMSASPWRDDGADMLIEAFLGKKVVDYSARKLIKMGYLVNPDIRFLAPTPFPRKKAPYQTVYSKYIIENEQRNALIVKAATKLVEQGFPTMVLFNAIKHGDILHNMLKKNIPVAILSGKDSTKIRDKVKDDIESGKTNCVLASKIFDIGVDLPTMSGLVVSGAGKSSVRALQRIGRVIRLSPGKTKAAVFDFADQAPYLKNHAQARKNIYEAEFDVSWPKRI